MPILNIADEDDENDTLNEPAATPESEKPERGRKAKGK
jgi:hypothetical protein